MNFDPSFVISFNYGERQWLGGTTWLIPGHVRTWWRPPNRLIHYPPGDPMPNPVSVRVLTKLRLCYGDTFRSQRRHFLHKSLLLRQAINQGPECIKKFTRRTYYLASTCSECQLIKGSVAAIPWGRSERWSYFRIWAWPGCPQEVLWKGIKSADTDVMDGAEQNVVI